MSRSVREPPSQAACHYQLSLDGTRRHCGSRQSRLRILKATGADIADAARSTATWCCACAARHAVTRRLRHLAETADIQATRANPHMLRHTFADVGTGLVLPPDHARATALSYLVFIPLNAFIIA